MLSPGIPDTNLPRVVIIGGGFGGLAIAKTLGNQEIQVIILDKNNYHTFQPLLYQVATGGLEPDSIATPFRKIFHDFPNIIFRMTDVQGVNAASKEVLTSIGSIRFDFLVIATGSVTNFFGMKEVMEHAMPMKSVPEALDLRSLILQNFEQALLVNDVTERNSLMNMVVVGGGPTGVEISGALGELKKHVLPMDYPELDIRSMNIHLIEAGDRLLAGMSDEASAMALEFLKVFDVNIWLNSGLKSFDGKLAYLGNDKVLNTRTLIWTAGVMGNPVPGLETILAKGNRIKTDKFCRAEGFENIFAIGDVATVTDTQNPKPHPMVAPVAMQQGKIVGKNILRIISGKPLLPFIYNDKGSMATIGRNKAVVDFKTFKTQGIFAWFLWMTVHLLQLVAFRNKLVVLVNWAWNYFSYDRGIRLIIRPFLRK